MRPSREDALALLEEAKGLDTLQLAGGRRLSVYAETRGSTARCKPGKCDGAPRWDYVWPRGNSAQLGKRCDSCALEIVRKHALPPGASNQGGRGP